MSGRIRVGAFLSLILGALPIQVVAQNSGDDASKIVQSAPQDFTAWKGEEFTVGKVMDHTAFRGTLNVYGARECNLYVRRVLGDDKISPPNYDCDYPVNNRVSQAAAWTEYERLAQQLRANHPDWKFTETNESDKGDADYFPTATRTLKVELPNVTIELYASNSANAFFMALNDLKGTPGYMVTLHFDSTLKDAPLPGPIPNLQ